MGVLDFFKRSGSLSRRIAALKSSDDDLFDDEFQRKLEYLAMVSKRVFSVCDARRAPHQEDGLRRRVRRSPRVRAGRRLPLPRLVRVPQRFDRLLIRLYEEEEDLSIYFILDTSASMGFAGGAKLKQAKRLTAALAYVGLANLDRIAIVTATDEISGRMQSTRGKARIFRVFRFLSGVKADGHTDLGAALRTFVAQHKRRDLAVLLTDLYDPAGLERGINALRFAKFEPFVMHMVDPNDARPDLRGDVRVYDCETGDEREVTVTAKVLERYAAAHAEYLEEARRFCTSRQVSYFRADVDAPFDELILRVFRRGGFLR